MELLSIVLDSQDRSLWIQRAEGMQNLYLKRKFLIVTCEVDSLGVLLMQTHVVFCCDKTHGRTGDVWKEYK